MKKLLLSFLFIATASVSLAQNAEADSAKKYGLASYLTTVKALAEFKMLSLTTDSQFKSTLNASKIKLFNSKYNVVKLYADQLINQLSADSYNSNRLKAYRAVNDLLKDGNSLPNRYGYYSSLLNKLDGVLETFLMMHYGSLAAGPSIEEYTGVASAIAGVITSDRDFREKKIQSITALLKELKLQSLGDLIKPKDKKD